VERLFGFVGLIVAVPILATIKVLIEELWINPLERRSAARPAVPLHRSESGSAEAGPKGGGSAHAAGTLPRR
jgi:hypothetical protein